MRSLVLLSLLGLSLAACGPNAVDEACAYPDDSRDCVEGAICTQDVGAGAPDDPFDPSWSSYTCRTDCTAGVTCPEGYACRAVVGRETLSSCQPVAAAD